MTIKLFTRTGEFVTEATIPEFDDQPDVILWGARVFCLPDLDRDRFAATLADDEFGYVEAFTYALS